MTRSPRLTAGITERAIFGACAAVRPASLFVYGKVNLNETTLDNTWRTVGLIGSKSLEIGADSTCENRRVQDIEP
jgi:hypothetical protein